MMDLLCQGDTDQLQADRQSKEGPVQPHRIIGFNSQMAKGLHVTPDARHLVYAMGQFVVIEEILVKAWGKQRVLASHTGLVTALAVSSDGQLIASSQRSEVGGQKARVLLWQFDTGELLMEHSMHKESVQAMTFTFSSKYLLSLGCPSDGDLVVWACHYRQPLCGNVAQKVSAAAMLCVAASKVDDLLFATAGDCYGRVWKLDENSKRFDVTELKFATARRLVTSMEITDFDNKEMPLLLCGTSSGDVLTFHLHTGCLQCVVKCQPAVHGVTCLCYLKLQDANTLDLLLGTGNGELRHVNLHVTRVKDGKWQGKMTPGGVMTTPWRHAEETAAITSIAKVSHGESVYVATANGHMYSFNLLRWNEQLVHTSSHTPIHAMTFARGSDDLLVVGEFEKVRVLNLSIFLEVRRYVRASRTCKAVAVNHDGTCIFSGWDCGTVIVLGFGTRNLQLKELYRIGSLQTKAITCLALTSSSETIVSGGMEGQTRVWRLADDVDTAGKRLRQGVLVHLVTPQTGHITCLKIAKSQQTFASSSEDGSIAICDIASGTRICLFKLDFCLSCVCFINDDLQVMASGYDGNLHFWEIMSQEYVRTLKACSLGPVTWVVSTTDSKGGVSVGTDQLVKFWNLQTGEVTHVGQGHGDVVTRVNIGPKGSVIVTGAKDGSLCVWRNPYL